MMPCLLQAVSFLVKGGLPAKKLSSVSVRGTAEATATIFHIPRCHATNQGSA